MKFTCFVGFLLIIFPAVVLAQDVELEKFVSKNCAAFIVIEEPAAFLDSIENFPLFEHPNLARASEILQDEEYSLLSTEVVSQLENQWEKLKANLSALDEVSFVLHPAGGAENTIYTEAFYWEPNSIPKFSIVLAGDQKVTDEIERTLLAGRSSGLEFTKSSIDNRDFQQSNAVEDRDNQDSGTDGDSEFYDGSDLDGTDGQRPPKMDLAVDFFKGLLDSLVVKKTHGSVIVSNDEKRALELSERLAKSSGKSFRSLSDHRSYKVIRKLLEERSDSPGVRMFFVPENLPELGAQIVTDSLSFEPKSLRAGGVFLSLDAGDATVEMEESDFEPLMEWDLVLTIAQPAENYGKVIESFRELQDPPEIALPIINCNALGFDSQLRNEAFKETIENYQEQFKEEVLGIKSSKIGSIQTGPTDVDDFSNHDYFHDAELYSGVGQLKGFDASSVAGFSDGRIEFEIADVDAGAVRRVEVYSVDDLEKMEVYFLKLLEEENQFYGTDRPLVEIENEYGRLFAREPIAVGPTAKEIPDDDPLFEEAIANNDPELFLNDQWMISTDHFTMGKVLRALCEESPAPSKFSQIFQIAKKRNDNQAPVKIGYRSVELHGRLYGSMERQHIMDKFQQPGQEKQMWEILNSEPDEFGFYDVIESEDDAVVAVSQLISDAMVETFDSSINLYTVDDSSFRVFGQIYSKVEK